MEINFEGKCALVTGSGQGIGRQLVKALVSAKAKKVYAVSRTKENLDSLLLEVPTIIPITVDLTNWDEVREKLSNIGPVDYLVNNAGMANLESFFDIKPESFDKIFNLNVKAAINVSQIVAKGMAERKYGSIVNVSSQASKMSLENHLLYGATKAALDSVTQTMALELGKYNIRVNAVNPTVVFTEMGRLAWSDPVKTAPFLKRIPLGRFAEVDEVVNAILFLLSDKASMINAVTLLVDGGNLSSS